jgi:hypothetical protein
VLVTVAFPFGPTSLSVIALAKHEQTFRFPPLKSQAAADHARDA